VTSKPATGDALDRGRASFARLAWADAYAQLSRADQERPLAQDDLERAALAAYLIAKAPESAELWTRAHQEALRAGDAPRAARCAFYVAFQHISTGQATQAFGWLARASRILDEAGVDCAERGYLLLPAAFRAIDEADFGAAYATFGKAAEIGARFHDRELQVVAQYGLGHALVGSGRTADGLALLDETMVALGSGDLPAGMVGGIYCGAIGALKRIFELRRAQDWTAVLSRWCEAQPDLVPFRGQCMVYRAELMQLHGAWPDAMEETVRACEQLSAIPGHPATGAAFYQRAELQRLRGDLTSAEELYREASRLGHTPHPGLALLRLAQGQIDAARAALRRALDETQDRANRAALLVAYVDTMLAADDAAAARVAAGELSSIAAERGAPFLEAIATQAMGAVLLGERDPRAALPSLRQSWSAWRELEAPYEAARVRVLVGLAYRALGDDDGAEMEFDAARSIFLELGAAPDIARVETLSRSSGRKLTGGLTDREVEVLRLVATGRTNRAIAAELVISEKTVARHVSNIFDKLGVSSRSAATAYAYEHKLV